MAPAVSTASACVWLMSTSIGQCGPCCSTHPTRTMTTRAGHRPDGPDDARVVLQRRQQLVPPHLLPVHRSPLRRPLAGPEDRGIRDHVVLPFPCVITPPCALARAGTGSACEERLQTLRDDRL